MAMRATSASSSRVKTMPVGLCGELSRISRVRGVTAARSASRSGRRAGPDIGTPTRWPRASEMPAA